MWIGTLGADYGFNETYPSYVESPVSRQDHYIKIEIRNEGDFWGECELRMDELRGYGTPIPSNGRIYYEMARDLRISPHLLALDGEYNTITKCHAIRKPSFYEYDNLPAKWNDISNVILSESSSVAEYMRSKK